MLNGFRKDLRNVKVAAAEYDVHTAAQAAFHSKQSFRFFEVEAVVAKVNCEFEVSGVTVLAAKASVPDGIVEVPHLAQDGSAPEDHLLEKRAGRKVEVAGPGKHHVELAKRVAHVQEARSIYC